MNKYQYLTEMIDTLTQNAVAFKKAYYLKASMLCEAKSDGVRQYRDGLTIEEAETERINA